MAEIRKIEMSDLTARQLAQKITIYECFDEFFPWNGMKKIYYILGIPFKNDFCYKKCFELVYWHYDYLMSFFREIENYWEYVQVSVWSDV